MADDPDKANILIVDDLPEKVLVYRTILEELGQNLVIARSGEDALRAVLGGEFAVILLDVQMPGLNGFETAALIRRRRRSAHTPIIFITAFADEVRQAEGYAQGAVDYILAPIVPEILRAKVRVFVDLFRMSQQVRRQAEEKVVLAEERARRESVEEANRRLTFLAGAAGILGQSLDVVKTARDAARVAVPYLSDAAALVLIDPPEGFSGVAMAETVAADVRVTELGGREELPESLRTGVDLAVAARRPLVLQSNVLAIPLEMRDRVSAVLLLSRANSASEFGPVDRATAEALASRAAVALENARLYREVQKADQQKNDFLSMLAHELRNPLAPIRNAVEVMKLGDGVPQQCVWAGGVIDRQVRHLTRLVDDLLDISRITRGKIELRTEDLDLGEIANQAVEAIRPLVEAKGHSLEISFPGNAIRVHGDSVRLAQVLTNLLINAAKYTDNSGQIRLNASHEGSEAVVSIRDSGIGIPADKLNTIFDMFAQVDDAMDRSQGGLGIGLTLVKRLVEMHGGSVAAKSDGVGRGSEFVVRLPTLNSGGSRPSVYNGSTLRANAVVRR